MTPARAALVLVHRVVRIALELLYTRFAWAYDAVAWAVSFGRWRAWQQVGVDALPDGRVLELGHGPGHLLRQRLLSGQPAIGLDRSPQMGRIARRRLSKVALEPQLVRADARRLPFVADAYAAILATFPTEYILDPLTLDECRRVLRPGCSLVVVAGVRINPRNLPDRLLQIVYRITGESPPAPETWTLPAADEGLRWSVASVEAPGAIVYRAIGSKS
jgi:ubiquinone/menaquinone biosynthesis C-methylase UbiE